MENITESNTHESMSLSLLPMSSGHFTRYKSIFWRHHPVQMDVWSPRKWDVSYVKGERVDISDNISPGDPGTDIEAGIKVLIIIINFVL